MDATLGYFCDVLVMPCGFKGKSEMDVEDRDERFYGRIRTKVRSLSNLEADTPELPFNDYRGLLLCSVDFNFHITGQDYSLYYRLPVDLDCSIMNATWGVIDYFMFRSDRSNCKVIMRYDQIFNLTTTSDRVMGVTRFEKNSASLSVYMSPVVTGEETHNENEISGDVEMVFDCLFLNGDMVVEIPERPDSRIESSEELLSSSKYIDCFESCYLMLSVASTNPVLVFKNKLKTTPDQTERSSQVFLDWFGSQYDYLSEHNDIFDMIRDSNYIKRECLGCWNIPY